MFDSSTRDSEGIDTEPRTVRALTEYHSVLDDVGPARGADGLYTVVSQSGKSYTVDETGACTCPDASHNLDVDAGELCKHARRCAFATGDRPIPADVAAVVDVDPDLGQHATASSGSSRPTAGSSRRATTARFSTTVTTAPTRAPTRATRPARTPAPTTVTVASGTPTLNSRVGHVTETVSRRPHRRRESNARIWPHAARIRRVPDAS